MKKLEEVMVKGKRGLDGCMVEVGRMFVEVMMPAQRIQMARADYRPAEIGLKKWGRQDGSRFTWARRS